MSFCLYNKKNSIRWLADMNFTFSWQKQIPLRNFQNFCTPLEILLSLIIEVNKEVVLFTRMPNFVSFMYFLLNCITGKQIPYANSLWTQVTDKFCAFHVISVEFYDSANKMQGRVGNITVLFSHCVKKKATLEEV